MKVLMFDVRESEKPFFENNKLSDFDITLYEDSLTEKLKLEDNEFEETDVISVYRSSILSEKVLKKFKNLRMIATRSYNYNHIDLRYCKEKNISVMNVGQYGEKAIAQYAFALIIALERRIREAVTDIRNNNVNPKFYEGKLINNLTIGIVGCGIIGIEIAKIAKFFDMKVLVSSYKELPAFKNLCNIVPFEKLLAESDIIALHMPYTGENYQIIGKDEFKRMKSGVILINTSCVDLLDIEELYKNLLSGKVKAAGLDIMDSDFGTKLKDLGNETMNTKGNSKITSKLMEMPNVIITPHVAYNTSDTINLVLERTINNIRDCCKGIYTNRVC